MITVADSAITLALIGIVGTVVTALFKLLQGNTQAQMKTADANALIAEETRLARQEAELGRKAQEKGFEEAKERNGHLGEQSLKIAQLITSQNKDVAKISAATTKTAETLSKSALIAAEDRDVLVGGNQVVHEQTVEHQTVSSTEAA